MQTHDQLVKKLMRRPGVRAVMTQDLNLDY